MSSAAGGDATRGARARESEHEYAVDARSISRRLKHNKDPHFAVFAFFGGDTNSLMPEELLAHLFIGAARLPSDEWK